MASFPAESPCLVLVFEEIPAFFAKSLMIAFSEENSFATCSVNELKHSFVTVSVTVSSLRLGISFDRRLSFAPKYFKIGMKLEKIKL